MLIQKKYNKMKRKTISEAKKKQVAGYQLYKCANSNSMTLKGLEDYKCPLWLSDKHNGSFDESGYEIDHIVEHCKTRDDSLKNLQALCKMCHMVKTKRFNINHKAKKKVTNSGASRKKKDSNINIGDKNMTILCVDKVKKDLNKDVDDVDDILQNIGFFI